MKTNSMNKILESALVFVQEEFNTAEEVIIFLSKKLLAEGYVKKDFLPAVLERERKYPTGLYLGAINVAIPHTDIKYVIRSGIAIVTLKTPVKFKKMDDPEKEIPVHIVFLLSVLDPKGYVGFLSKLTRSFKDESFIQKLYLEKNPSKLVESLKNILKAKVETET